MKLSPDKSGGRQSSLEIDHGVKPLTEGCLTSTRGDELGCVPDCSGAPVRPDRSAALFRRETR